MAAVVTSLLLALGQLADRAVLRILLKSVSVTIVGFIALSWAGWWLIDGMLGLMGWEEALFAGAGGLRGLASAILAVVGLWLCWRVVAMAVIQFFADDVVHAVEARHYPAAANAARELSFAEEARKSGGSAMRAIGTNVLALPFALALLITGIGTAILFWFVNALIVGRELQDMVWLRHRQNPQDPCPVNRFERFILGGVISAMLAVPVVNFLAPVVGAAAATHLVHRKKEAQ